MNSPWGLSAPTKKHSNRTVSPAARDVIISDGRPTAAAAQKQVLNRGSGGFNERKDVLFPLSVCLLEHDVHHKTSFKFWRALFNLCSDDESTKVRSSVGLMSTHFWTQWLCRPFENKWSLPVRWKLNVFPVLYRKTPVQCRLKPSEPPVGVRHWRCVSLMKWTGL